MFLAFSAVAIASSEEVIVGCTAKIAFYEVAPKKMANSMRKAVTSACAESQVRVGLCSGQTLRFVRAVDPGGDGREVGYACRGESVGDFKFLSLEMLDAAGCVPLAYDFESKRHYVARADQQSLTASPSE